MQIDYIQKIEELSKNITNFKNELNKKDKQSESEEITQLELRKMMIIKGIDALKNRTKLSNLEYLSKIKNKEKEIAEIQEIVNELEK